MDDEGRKQRYINTAARVQQSRDKMPNEKRMDQSKEPRELSSSERTHVKRGKRRCVCSRLITKN